jgi:hypothetical protein
MQPSLLFAFFIAPASVRDVEVFVEQALLRRFLQALRRAWDDTLEHTGIKIQKITCVFRAYKLASVWRRLGFFKVAVTSLVRRVSREVAGFNQEFLLAYTR